MLVADFLAFSSLRVIDVATYLLLANSLGGELIRWRVACDVAPCNPSLIHIIVFSITRWDITTLRFLLNVITFVSYADRKDWKTCFFLVI